MKRSFTKLMAAFALLVFMMPSLVAWGQTRSDVTLNIQSYAQANSWQNGTKYLTATVSPVTFTANGGTNTGKYYTSGNEWRYYQTESASITVSVSSDYTLSSIAFTYNSTNSGVLKDGASTVSSGSTVSVSGTSATFSVGNSGSATNGQVKFTKIVVTYVAVGGNPIVATPTFEPNVGAFLDSQEVSIACATDGATIYYTTNGNDPTTSSSVYSAPFTINATTTVKALAVKTGMDNSEIASAEFVKVTPMSVDDAIAAITAAGSNIPIENQCVTGIVCTASNNIYSGKLSYWISDDGTTTNRLEAYNGLGLYGEAFTSVDDVQVGDVVVIYGDLTKYNSTYEFAAGNYLLSLVRPAIVVATPTFDPDGGTFTAVQSVTISCETPDVTIYYTTDGSDPTNESTLYEGAVTVGESMTLKARAYDNNNNASAIASATFTINLPYSGAPYARINNVSYLTDGAKVIFAARFDDNADNYYAMTATASGKPEGVLFTSTTSNDFEVLPAAIVDAESTYCWTVGVTDNGYTFTNANNQTIGYTSGTNFATGGDNTEWTVGLGTSGTSAMVPGYEAFNVSNKNNAVRAFALNNSHNFAPYDINSNNNSGTYNFSLDIFVQGAEPVPTPSITASNIDIAYDVTNDTIEYTINNPVEGGILTVAPSASWLRLTLANDGTLTFRCQANTSGAVRTATVTLTYTYNTDQTVTKEITITQAAAPVIYSTIPALFEAATSTSASALVTFDNWTVSGVSTNGKNVFVTDGTNGFVIFDSEAGLDAIYSVGDILSGTAVPCSLVLYHGFAELTDVNAEDLTMTAGGTVSVADIAMADLAGVNTGALVSYENLTCSVDNSGSTPKYYLSDGTTTLQVYNALYAFEALTNGKTYNITGIYQQYNTTKEILPRSAEDIEEIVSLEPSVTVDPATIDAPYDGAEGTLTLSYENIPDFISFDYYFCDAEGNALEEDPDWIDAEIQEEDEEYSLYYLIGTNEGEARTAYLKVYTFIENGEDLEEVYAIVTINQAEFVIDFVELPFEWVGGTKDTLLAITGVSGHGLGTNYAESNAPYRVKFDTDGDYILIKTDQRPGIVTLGIKKLGGAGASSITLEGSSDGVTFTTIETFANEGDANEVLLHVSSVDFGANDRYVRIYFNKPSSGGANVGVGPISIAEYVEPVPAITVESTTITAPYQGIEEGTLNVTYTLIETSASIYWYTDNTGTTTTDEPDWLTADINETTLNVDYMIDENNDEARTAYFKVYALDAEFNDVYSDLVTITQEAAPLDYNLTVEPFENLEIVTFVNDDMVMEEDGTISVTAGALVMLSIVADEGYAIETLMVNGVDHANDIAADFTYSFEMPDEDVTISATAVEVTASTYTLATSIESGKTYIIVGVDGADYYAMGKQNNNNRAAVSINVEDETATAIVSDDEVHEFVVTFEETVDETNYYSIYDNGYLYAAGSGSNWLRTESVLSDDSKWGISIGEDGVASVVAGQSANRNVMQYNSGSDLFSCYSSASQKPVYLYVKNEEPVITTITQTTEFVEGWNWFSTYVTTEDPVDLLDMLKESLGENALQIQANNGAVTEFDGEEWFGDLDEEGIFNEQTYLIQTSAACTFMLEGTPAVVDEYEITINPGWNWIGFPSAAPIDVLDALANFEAEEGDQIQCSDATSTEYDGEEWFGDLETFTPGLGYMYYSSSQDTKILVFSTAAKKKLNNAIRQ